MASKMDVLRHYCKRNFYLFPVRKDTKRPAIKDNLNSASNNIEQLMEWEKKFPDCNWAISCAKSGLVAVDVDHAYGGMEAWATMIHKNGEPETLKAISGSGGLHYVFNADKSKRYRGKIQKGIDVKYNGYIVVYPSLHERTGNFYKWTNIKSQAAGECPAWLSDLIQKDDRVGKADPTFKFGNQYLEKLVKILKEQDLDYEQWMHAGMALHAATEGSPEGLQLYLSLTQGNSYQDGDLEKAEGKWDSFSSTDNGITQLSLGYIIRKNGGVVPSPSYDEDLRAFKEEKIRQIRDEKITSGFVPKGEHYICWKKDEIVDWFNDKGYSVLMTGGKNPFMRVKGLDVTTMGEKALRDLTGPYQFAEMKDTGTDIKVVLSPAYKVWMDSRRRKEYDRIVFKPVAGERELNLWGEIGMKPIYGETPTLIIDFIEKSLCAGDKRKAAWLLDWLAHIIQKPEQRTTLVPVLISNQGAGKGLLMDHIMGPILGDYYTVVMSSRELMERFNVELSKKFLTFIDEATWRGNKTEDGILKRLCGSPIMKVEEKFGATYKMENYSRYLIGSNNMEAVALEVGNRRYVPMEGDDSYANKLEYFEPIGEAVKEVSYLATFLGFLKSRDLENYNPYKILENNTAGEIAKINTAGPVAMFWDDTFSENPKKIWDASNGLHCGDTFEAFKDFCNGIKTYEKAISPKSFWIKSKKFMPILPPHVRKRFGGETRAWFRSVTMAECVTNFYKTMCLETPQLMGEAEYLMERFEDVNNDGDGYEF